MSMTVTIDLPREMEGELRRRAADAGLDVGAYALDLIRGALGNKSRSAEAPVAPLDEEDDDPRPWRGVYTPPMEEDVLFTTALELDAARLERWEPKPVDPLPRGRHDDE
jgi:hypothetical protein